ncbi:hypothetical protein Zmor_024385 [Zophobas morio]|uniref:1-alkyl-2-acetylglycerophosphocholine esterase n=1 Tax=Zophobas morio TaxID=2755281 RepID=A0AA38I0G9_9CUCU|nr:hypothetical protein Zmor_024385 [Zophobas morio]
MWGFGRKVQHLPESTGQFLPGCMDVMLDYSPEGIFMRLYYPTSEDKNDPSNCSGWIPWMPTGNGYILGLAKVLFLFPFVIRFMQWWSAHDIPVIYGSKPKLDKKLKCIVLSHGLGAHRALYSNVCCELASRGYLVAALEHKGGSSCYTYYYKNKDDAENNIKAHVEYEQVQLGKNHFGQRKRQIGVRIKECNKALDFLLNLNKGQVPHNVIDDVPTDRKIEFKLEDLVGKLDVDTLTMAGHSFGGATALLTLSQRPEFKQGLLLDPWMYPIKDDNLPEKVQQPLVFINTQTFHIVSNVQAMSKYLTNNDRTMYTILHTTHEHQGDTAMLFGSWMNWFMKKLDPLVALKINNCLVLEFLDKYVGSPSDITDCREFLELEKPSYEVGLTKPWA